MREPRKNVVKIFIGSGLILSSTVVFLWFTSSFIDFIEEKVLMFKNRTKYKYKVPKKLFQKLYGN